MLGPAAHAVQPASAAVVRVESGATQRAFSMREPAGVVLLARIVVPHGTVASVRATIPGVAGVSVGTSAASGPNTCHRTSAVDVCTQAQEWCPMPAARWRVTLYKRSGPPGVIRFVFRVGAPA